MSRPGARAASHLNRSVQSEPLVCSSCRPTLRVADQHLQNGDLQRHAQLHAATGVRVKCKFYPDGLSTGRSQMGNAGQAVMRMGATSYDWYDTVMSD